LRTPRRFLTLGQQAIVLACGINRIRLIVVVDEADEPKRGMRRRLHVLQLQGLEPPAQDIGLGSAESSGESLESRLIRIGEVDLRRFTDALGLAGIVMMISHDSKL
jgi:hypothetical protein